MPTAQNASHESVPCAVPISQRALERRPCDGHEPLDHPFLVAIRHRQVREHAAQQPRPADQEEEHRVEHHDELKEEDGRGDRGRRDGIDEQRAGAPDQLAGSSQDLLPVGLEHVEAYLAEKREDDRHERKRPAQRVAHHPAHEGGHTEVKPG
jgi:hypothetical protein